MGSFPVKADTVKDSSHLTQIASLDHCEFTVTNTIMGLGSIQKMIQTTLIRRIHKEFLVSIHHTLWVLMQSKASFWPYFYQEFFGCVEQKKKMFREEFPCLYYLLMSYFFEKCRASQTKMVLKKSWSTSNLVTRHIRLVILWRFSHNHRFIIESTTLFCI